MRIRCLVLLSVGVIVSGYLLYRHFAIADVSVQSGADFCSAVFGTGCDEALQSPLAVQLGLPLAGWGLVYYGTLASLLLLGWTIGDTFRFEATTAAFLLALAAGFCKVSNAADRVDSGYYDCRAGRGCGQGRFKAGGGGGYSCIRRCRGSMVYSRDMVDDSGGRKDLVAADLVDGQYGDLFVVAGTGISL